MLKRNTETIENAVFVFHGKDIILRKDRKTLTMDDLTVLRESTDGGEIWSEPEAGITWMMAGNTPLPDGYETVPVRLHACDMNMEDEEYVRLFRAKGMASWTNDTRHCVKCGGKLEPHAELSALVCSECGKIVFPRIEPCVIVLVRKGNKMLLARHNQRNNDIYACIAGFMETGETAEHAVRRELIEETGIKVKNIQYFGTQSWPFPSQLMIAFTAEWESGEPQPQDGELADIGWFLPGECPNTPQPGSIAYRMIQSFKEGKGAGKACES